MSSSTGSMMYLLREEPTDPSAALPKAVAEKLRSVTIEAQVAFRKTFRSLDERACVVALCDYATSSLAILAEGKLDRYGDDFDSLKSSMWTDAVTSVRLAHCLFRDVVGNRMHGTVHVQIEEVVLRALARIEDEWWERAASREAQFDAQRRPTPADVSEPCGEPEAPREPNDLPGQVQPVPCGPRLGKAPATATAMRIESFMARILEQAGRRIDKKHIWRVAGYTDPTEFGKYQREDEGVSAGTRTKFDRVLSLSTDDFLARLRAADESLKKS